MPYSLKCRFKVGDRVRDPNNPHHGEGTCICNKGEGKIIFDNYDYGPKDEYGRYTNWHFGYVSGFVLVKKHNQGYIDLVALQNKLKDKTYA